MPLPLDLTGKVFGRLTAIELDSQPRSGGRHWRCRCACGKTVVQRAAYLVAGRRKSCGCLPAEERNARPHADLAFRYWDKLLRQAQRRGIHFDATPEHVIALFRDQRGLCALSGVPISLPISSAVARASTHTASLDRIDSGLPYTNGNVQWVHKKVNMMKQEMGVAEFIRWCQIIGARNGS